MDVGATVRGKAAIVGVADIASPTGQLDRSDRALRFDMTAAALADAGLSIGDVDGLLVAGFGTPALDLAEALRIHPRFTDGTGVGGSSFEFHVEHAAAAIAAGLCEVALIVYAQTPRSSKGGAWGGARRFFGPSPMSEWEMAYGMRMPMGPYALAASRHAHEFGTTDAQRAEVSVATRAWAALNPNARYREPITVGDVLASPVLASPLHRLECCLVTDGAGAVVLTSAARARDLARPPVFDGIFLLVEAVRQLRREADGRQVPNATVGVAHGCGGVLSSTGTVVLGREETL
jgi:acetyl-CoA acetyltransferase